MDQLALMKEKVKGRFSIGCPWARGHCILGNIENDLDDANAPTEDEPAADAAVMSVGTHAFATSMDRTAASDESDHGTVLEVASPDDIRELTR